MFMMNNWPILSASGGLTRLTIAVDLIPSIRLLVFPTEMDNSFFFLISSYTMTLVNKVGSKHIPIYMFHSGCHI